MSTQQMKEGTMHYRRIEHAPTDLTWHVDRRDMGQIVEVAYAHHRHVLRMWKRITDTSYAPGEADRVQYYQLTGTE